MPTECPNCLEKHEVFPDVCVLHVLLGVAVHGRQSLTNEAAHVVLKNCNADALWDDLGPIVDRLEAGYYDNDAEG